MSAPASSGLRVLFPALAAGVLVVAGYAAIVASSRTYVGTGPAAGEPYNLMVEGFQSGHAWLAKEAPPALALAANPYEFKAYRPYLAPPWNLIDLSYYRGHLYAYFGVTPAVILFWPYRILAGAPLRQATAVLLFSILGYAVSVGLALAAWRRYFPQVGPRAGAAIALVLGSATTLPVFLVRPGLYEVSISCAFLLVMLSLAALWNAWHRPGGKASWIAAASLAFGLAVGSRPSLLFASVILFLPAAALLVSSIREKRKTPWLGQLLAALLPISAVGAGLAAFNFCRFGDPLQFGHDYQLSGNNVYGTRSFDLRFFVDNFRIYFLAPLRWHLEFPFVWEPVLPTLSPGHLPVEFFFGTLANLPFLLLAAMVPIAVAGTRTQGARRLSTGIPTLLLILFAAVALPICCYAGATGRYLLDFTPALALLALIGFLGLEGLFGRNAVTDTSAPAPSMLPGAVIRTVARGALVYSVGVGWLVALALSSFYSGAEHGMALLNSGNIGDAVATYKRVCRINPDFKGQAELGIGTALIRSGQAKQGTEFLKWAVRDKPGLAAAHFNLGTALFAQGEFGEAAGAFGRAAALDRFDAEAEADEGEALFRLGRTGEAILHEKAALGIDPTFGPAGIKLREFESQGGAAGKL